MTSRRELFTGAAAAASSLVLIKNTTVVNMLPQARYDAQLAGLKAAARQLDPEIVAWTVYAGEGYGRRVRFALVGIDGDAVRYGDPICAGFDITRFEHVERGPIPALPFSRDDMGHNAFRDEREAFYRAWLA